MLGAVGFAEKSIAATCNSAHGLFGLFDRDVEMPFIRIFVADASGHNRVCFLSSGGKLCSAAGIA